LKKFTILTASLLCLGASPLFAQDRVAPMLDQGTKELALSGIIEFPEFEEVDFDLDVSYGYFFKDGWEVGLRALGSDLSGIERFDFSLFSEYNFNRQSNIVPFLGASVGVASVSFDGFDDFESSTTLAPNDDESTVFSLQGGIKWFVRPYMAVSTSIAFNVSTDDIYLADNELKDNLTRFRLGLRYYF
jgi:opacity protein-like surface antigen